LPGARFALGLCRGSRPSPFCLVLSGPLCRGFRAFVPPRCPQALFLACVVRHAACGPPRRLCLAVLVWALALLGPAASLLPHARSAFLWRSVVPVSPPRARPRAPWRISGSYPPASVWLWPRAAPPCRHLACVSRALLRFLLCATWCRCLSLPRCWMAAFVVSPAPLASLLLGSPRCPCAHPAACFALRAGFAPPRVARSRRPPLLLRLSGRCSSPAGASGAPLPVAPVGLAHRSPGLRGLLAGAPPARCPGRSLRSPRAPPGRFVFTPAGRFACCAFLSLFCPLASSASAVPPLARHALSALPRPRLLIVPVSSPVLVLSFLPVPSLLALRLWLSPPASPSL